MISVDEQKLTQVMSSFQVPVKPHILSQLQDKMREQEPDLIEVANIIVQDVGLSAAILKIINSPFYGMNRRISEIKQAVLMLGLTTINGLATALLLKASIAGKASISLERF